MLPKLDNRIRYPKRCKTTTQQTGENFSRRVSTNWELSTNCWKRLVITSVMTFGPVEDLAQSGSS
jgi:hypothetical protein